MPSLFKNRKERRAQTAVAELKKLRQLDEIQADFNNKSFQLGNLFYQSGMIQGQLKKIHEEIELLMKQMENVSLEGHKVKQQAIQDELAKAPKQGSTSEIIQTEKA